MRYTILALTHSLTHPYVRLPPLWARKAISTPSLSLFHSIQHFFASRNVFFCRFTVLTLSCLVFFRLEIAAIFCQHAVFFTAGLRFSFFSRVTLIFLRSHVTRGHRSFSLYRISVNQYCMVRQIRPTCCPLIELLANRPTNDFYRPSTYIITYIILCYNIDYFCCGCFTQTKSWRTEIRSVGVGNGKGSSPSQQGLRAL